MAKSVYIILLTVFVLFYTEVVSVRRIGMTGGWTQQDVDSTTTKNLTDFAVKMYNQRSNHINYKTLIKIKESRSQLVAGVKYFISFVIGETNCRKNRDQIISSSQCQLVSTNTIETCNATIWQRVWLNSTKLLSLDCN